MLRSHKRDLYVVPDLPIKEIIDYYAEIQIPLRPNDILKPTPTSTLKLFDMLLELYKGDRTADIVSKYRNEEDFMDFEDSLSTISVHRRMSEFLQKIGIQSFSLKHIMQPEPKKLISILSVIVNFSMYRDNKRDLYERVSGAISERESMRNDILAKMKKAESTLKKLENEALQNEGVKRELENEMFLLENELKECCKTQRTKANELEKIKEEKTFFFDKLSSYQLLSLNLKQEMACLKTQIVSDPEKLLELLSEMRNMIVKERDSLKALQKRRSDLTEKVEQFQDAINRIKKLNKNAVQSRSLDKEIEKLQKDSQDIEDQIKNDEATTSSLKIKLGHVNRQISHLESKILTLQDNDKKCASEIAYQLQHLKLNYEKISDERMVINSKALENMRQCKHIEFETFKLKNAHESDLTDVRSRLCELKDQIFRYTSALKQYTKN
jgi:kinetochore protein Nuf2